MKCRQHEATLRNRRVSLRAAALRNTDGLGHALPAKLVTDARSNVMSRKRVHRVQIAEETVRRRVLLCLGRNTGNLIKHNPAGISNLTRLN